MTPFSKALFHTLLIAAMGTQLTGCFTAAVGGAAAGASIATDNRTSGIYIEDENIEIKASQQIRKALGEEAHVNVTSYNLNVLLTGEAPTEAAKAEAERITQSVESVKNITNELVVGPKTSISDRANDTYITSKVKAKFLAEKNFSTNDVKIVTEASVVYLMGIVKQRQADIATEIARTTDGVAKVVKVFEYQN
ncbi:MAG: BON domain-containing protein [Betaproteobacteria bacterium]|nr:BON domain-containing protein [Betaproteobacteria bacterium]